MAGKTAYSQKELDELRERLLAEQVELQEQLATIEEQSFATSQSDISGEVSFDEENADAGTFTFERERDLSIENNVRDLLGKIERALGRIEDARPVAVRDRRRRVSPGPCHEVVGVLHARGALADPGDPGRPLPDVHD